MSCTLPCKSGLITRCHLSGFARPAASPILLFDACVSAKNGVHAAHNTYFMAAGTPTADVSDLMLPMMACTLREGLLLLAA